MYIKSNENGEITLISYIDFDGCNEFKESVDDEKFINGGIKILEGKAIDVVDWVMPTDEKMVELKNRITFLESKITK